MHFDDADKGLSHSNTISFFLLLFPTAYPHMNMGKEKAFAAYPHSCELDYNEGVLCVLYIWQRAGSRGGRALASVFVRK